MQGTFRSPGDELPAKLPTVVDGENCEPPVLQPRATACTRAAMPVCGSPCPRASCPSTFEAARAVVGKEAPAVRREVTQASIPSVAVGRLIEIALRQREAEKVESVEKISSRINRAKRNFIRTHESKARREDVAALIEEIGNQLDYSPEAVPIRSRPQPRLTTPTAGDHGTAARGGRPRRATHRSSAARTRRSTASRPAFPGPRCAC